MVLRNYLLYANAIGKKMAHIKAGGTTKGNRDAIGKRLGVKRYGGEKVVPGNIIMRQRGTKFYPGTGADMGKDHTIFAVASGTVTFLTRRGRTFIAVT